MNANYVCLLLESSVGLFPLVLVSLFRPVCCIFKIVPDTAVYLPTVGIIPPITPMSCWMIPGCGKFQILAPFFFNIHTICMLGSGIAGLILLIAFYCPTTIITPAYRTWYGYSLYACTLHSSVIIYIFMIDWPDIFIKQPNF